MGMTIENDLNTANSRQKWLEWKRRADPSHYLDPKQRRGISRRAADDRGRKLDREHPYGTINCDGVSRKVRSRSHDDERSGGRSPTRRRFSRPAPTYVDGEAWRRRVDRRGEANFYNLSSYLIVENMRRGMRPKDAATDALRRVKSNTIESGFVASGNPNFRQLLRRQRGR
jgi:N4-(beta-N-acetylglucosaminyl)-L-asparaginase